MHAHTSIYSLFKIIWPSTLVLKIQTTNILKTKILLNFLNLMIDHGCYQMGALNDSFECA